MSFRQKLGIYELEQIFFWKNSKWTLFLLISEWLFYTKRRSPFWNSECTWAFLLKVSYQKRNFFCSYNNIKIHRTGRRNKKIWKSQGICWLVSEFLFQTQDKMLPPCYTFPNSFKQRERRSFIATGPIVHQELPLENVFPKSPFLRGKRNNWRDSHWGLEGVHDGEARECWKILKYLRKEGNAHPCRRWHIPDHSEISTLICFHS